MMARHTEADRFALAARALRQQRGGRPTAQLVNGKIVFTYPDGTQTCGGAAIKASYAEFEAR